MTEETIFVTALDKRTPADRSAYLDEACAGDAVLRQRVEVLLKAHDDAGAFLDRPAVEQIAACGPQSQDSAEAIAESQARANPGETQAERPTGGDGPSLDFLTPSQNPGSLGRLSHYEVVEVVGRGGMGVVLRAFDEVLHRVVAIKVMAPQLATNATARKRFRREAQAAAAVRDEHVIDIHAVEEVNGLPYLVMEYVSGISLQDRLDQSGPLELKEILRIGMQTAAGLAKAHAQGLIHRDIKPSNILLENGVQRVKITDFGLARAVDDASLTQSGVIAGTPQYMAPEQARGEAVDHRADLFSLGSVLYAMCTGRPPFRASSWMAVLKRVCDDTPRPVREINPEIPDWLAAIIDRLHVKDPGARFQSAAEVAELLGQHLAHLQQPALVPMPPQVGRPYAGATTAARLPALLWPVLLMLTLFLLIPVVMAGWLLDWFLPSWLLVGLSVFVSGTITLTVLNWFVVRLAARRKQEQAAPLPPRVPMRAARRRKRSRWLRPAIGVAALVALLALFEVTDLTNLTEPIRRMFPPDGTLIVHVEDPGLSVRIDGKKISTAGPGSYSFRLPSGTHRVDVFQGDTLVDTIMIDIPIGPCTVNTHVPRPVTAKPAAGEEMHGAAGGDAVKVVRQARLTLRGNPCRTPAVAFSPDKKTLATADDQGWIFLWDALSGNKLTSFQAHPTTIWSLAFSPDGKLLASGCWDGTAKIWDVGTHQEQATLPSRGERIWSVAFSPDSKLLAVASGDHSALWDVDLKKLRLEVCGTPLVSAAFSPKGGLLAMGNAHGGVMLVDVFSKQTRGNLDGHGSQVRLAFSTDGNTLVTASQDKTVFLWDIDTRQKRATLDGFQQSIESVACSPDGRLLATGGGNERGLDAPGEVTIWDMVQRKKLAQLEGHSGCVHTVAFSPDGKTLATASHDQTVRLWDVPENLLAANAVDRPPPFPAVPPFVILGRGKAHRAFATLAEAVAAAQWGDTIEIRSNGPFASPPVFIRKALTIRAGAGARPVIELNPAQVKDNIPLLESNAPLVLEGLQLRRIGKERNHPGSTPNMVVMREASVRAANCRFVAYPDCVALMAYWSPVCEVRNCEFLSSGLFGRVDHFLPHRGRLILDNNVMLGGDIGAAFHYRQPDLAGVSIELTRNTLVVQTPICLFLDTPPAPQPPGADAPAKPIRLQASDNLLDGQFEVMEFYQSADFLSRRQPLDAGSAQDLLGRLIAWKEQNNVYPKSISLLVHFVKSREPLPAGKSLADWNRFWGVRDTTAVRGEIRYRGGDRRSRALIQLEQVTAKDFRLQADSPGKGAGGRDLGADVDLVGPGPAYERWKQTPDYRQWLKDTGHVQEGK